MLVVVSIIGILAALATVSFTSTQKQARDTQRKSDLKQYQNSLEAFANKNNGLYPGFSNGVQASGALCTSLALSNCPEDPKFKTDSSYYYHYRSDGTAINGTAVATQYVLWSKLENVSGMYWVVCSTGSSGKISSSNTFTGGVCPAGLTQ